MKTGFFGAKTYSPFDDTRTKILLLCLFGLTFALSLTCFFLVTSSQKSEDMLVPHAIIQNPETRSVLLPLKEIAPGMLLQPSLFKIEKRLIESLDEKTLESFEEISGQYSKRLLHPNQPLLLVDITDKAPTSAITANIGEGYRAVTIRVNETKSMVGWVQPGSFIDVTWITKTRGEAAIAVLVQNAFVLSIDKETVPNAHPDRPIPTTLTLRVTEDDAASILLAESSGELGVVLRGEGSHKASKPIFKRTTELPGGPLPATPEHRREGTVVIDGRKYQVLDGELVLVKKN